MDWLIIRLMDSQWLDGRTDRRAYLSIFHFTSPNSCGAEYIPYITRDMSIYFLHNWSIVGYNLVVFLLFVIQTCCTIHHSLGWVSHLQSSLFFRGSSIKHPWTKTFFFMGLLGSGIFQPSWKRPATSGLLARPQRHRHDEAMPLAWTAVQRRSESHPVIFSDKKGGKTTMFTCSHWKNLLIVQEVPGNSLTNSRTLGCVKH